MTAFTEAHLRRMMEANKDRTVAFHLIGGSVIRGVLIGIDKDPDGFIEVLLNTHEDRVRFVTPVGNIVAYEVEAPDNA